MAAPVRTSGFARRGRGVSGVRGMVFLGAGGMHKGNGSPSECEVAVPRVTKRTRGGGEPRLVLVLLEGQPVRQPKRRRSLPFMRTPRTWTRKLLLRDCGKLCPVPPRAAGTTGVQHRQRCCCNSPPTALGAASISMLGDTWSCWLRGSLRARASRASCPRCSWTSARAKVAALSPQPALCVQGCEGSCHCTCDLCASFPHVRAVMDAGCSAATRCLNQGHREVRERQVRQAAQDPGCDGGVCA